MFNLLPKDTVFYDLFENIADRVVASATHLHKLTAEFPRIDAAIQMIRNEEHEADNLAHAALDRLDRTFITPFDREDIHTLATSLDDVLDNMEETANRFAMFRIDKPTPEAVSLAEIIQDCCLRLEHAIRALRTMKNAQLVQNHLKEIGRLENKADKIYRDTESKLFANPPADILQLIKWRELYSLLEATVDACKNVSQVISEIVIKGT